MTLRKATIKMATYKDDNYKDQSDPVLKEVEGWESRILPVGAIKSPGGWSLTHTEVGVALPGQDLLSLKEVRLVIGLLEQKTSPEDWKVCLVKRDYGSFWEFEAGFYGAAINALREYFIKGAGHE